MQPSLTSKRPCRCIGPTSIAIPPFTTGRTSGSPPLSSCPGRSGIAVILIGPPEPPIVPSHTAGSWDMPIPLPTPSGMPAWPRSSPGMSPPPAPTNNCVALASEHGFAYWAARGRILQGWADAQEGEATTGIDRIRDGLAAAEATGARLNTPFYLALLAEALTLAGKVEE